MKIRSNTAWIGIPPSRLDGSKSAEAKAKKEAFFEKMAEDDDEEDEDEDETEDPKKTKGKQSFFERMKAAKAAKAAKAGK